MKGLITFYVSRFGLSVLLSGLFLIPAAGTIFAHAELIEAEPAPGTVLTSSPGEIRLTFNEPVATGSHAALYTADFQSVAGVESRLEPEAPEQLVAAVPELAPGVYSVQWTAVSADGHEISGSYAFSVGVPFAEPEQPSPPLPWWQLSLLLLVSALLTGAFIRSYRQRRGFSVINHHLDECPV